MSTKFQAAYCSGNTRSAEAQIVLPEDWLVAEEAVLLKRQEKIAGLTRRSFGRRSWDRPPREARLLPFPFSVVSGAQPCPFSFVSAPTLSDASDMFDFP